MTVRVHVERDGPRVLLAMRGPNGTRATLDMHKRGASSLAAVLRARADDDDDGDAEMILSADLTAATEDP